MRNLNMRLSAKLAGIVALCLLGGGTLIHCKADEGRPAAHEIRVPIVLAHLGSSQSLERPAVLFDHDLHTKALKQCRSEDCGVCHVLKQTDTRLVNPDVKVFKFPKVDFDPTSKTEIMYAYHEACVNCHRKTSAEGRKAGPDIGLCGKCHVKRPYIDRPAWGWDPVFNYARHAKHLEAIRKVDGPEEMIVAQNIQVIGEVTDANKTCQVCHHVYKSEQKRLIYQKDTENSCKACHKAKDEKNARSMKAVAHSACIGCHMKLAEKVMAELTHQGRSELTEQDRKRFGPLECRGCHGEHKELTPEEIVKIPRLVRGQKDVVDLSLVATSDPGGSGTLIVSSGGSALVRMKVVPFNHKNHEPRAQFCTTCHHHSLEKCVNCHTPTGDLKKGGGVSYERAFHNTAARQACAGCHAEAKGSKKCAGCHQRVPNGVPAFACSVCHRGPSQGKMVEVSPSPPFVDQEKVPEKLQIKLLEKEFKSVDFPHLKIVNKLLAISNESSLARYFHAGKEQALCSGCHHRTELQHAAAKAPACSTCHTRPFDSGALGKPGLLGAYHRQCIGCHQSMDQKPAALECVKCHPAKEGIRTADLIPPVTANR
ncbi:MAG: cytochrome c3 family protein [Desulfomonile sp.]|nr:cytochrome c3 family protein [Desulfomonile sp.]